MVISDHKGSVLEAIQTHKVCTVNLVGAMGAGNAREFRDRYPSLYYYYKKSCRFKQFSTGHIATCPLEDGSIAILLPTKIDWKHPSPIELIEMSLQTLKRYLLESNITEVAMPPPGCGHGGMDYFSQSKPLLESIFHNTPIQIHIYHF